MRRICEAFRVAYFRDFDAEEPNGVFFGVRWIPWERADRLKIFCAKRCGALRG
jgi:hypothetical protein